jgi:hypothetical protein
MNEHVDDDEAVEVDEEAFGESVVVEGVVQDVAAMWAAEMVESGEGDEEQEVE